MSRSELRRKIYEYDFAIHELVLFLDSHPTSKKALALLKEYRQKRYEMIAEYEEEYGPYIATTDDVPISDCWQWLKGPWPWENNFMEAK